MIFIAAFLFCDCVRLILATFIFPLVKSIESRYFSSRAYPHVFSFFMQATQDAHAPVSAQGLKVEGLLCS